MAAIDDARARIEEEVAYWYGRLNSADFCIGHENVAPDKWVVVSLALAALEGERILKGAQSVV